MREALREYVRIAEDFPLDEVIARYAEDECLPKDVAQEHARELRRFLALTAYNQASGKKPYAMRGPIDELWHTFVIFTKKYQDFCDRLGAGFIHHFPNTEKPKVLRYGSKATEKPEGSKLGQQYVNFLQSYKESFGEAPSPHLWPVPSKDRQEYAGASCGCGCACGCGCSCIA